MERLKNLLQPDTGQPAHPIHILDNAHLERWMSTLSSHMQATLKAQNFGPGKRRHAIMPGRG